MSPRRQFLIAWLVCFGVFVVFPWVCVMVVGYACDPSMRNPYADQMETACYNGDTKAVQSALRQGADVNAPVWEDETALMRALIFGRLDTVKALLAAGADVNAKSSHGSALVFAESSSAKNASKIVALLKSAGASR